MNLPGFRRLSDGTLIDPRSLVPEREEPAWLDRPADDGRIHRRRIVEAQAMLTRIAGGWRMYCEELHQAPLNHRWMPMVVDDGAVLIGDVVDHPTREDGRPTATSSPDRARRSAAMGGDDLALLPTRPARRRGDEPVSSARFPGLELTDWRSRLVDAHPALFPDAKPMRDGGGDWIFSAGLPSVENGWRDVIERLCWRLDVVAARSEGSVAIFGIDEKCAELRIRVACEGATDEDVAEVELAVELAEARSGLTCGICGERGGTWDHRGWLTARCDRHGEGTPDRDPRRSIQVTAHWKSGRIVRTARSYDWDRDTFVAVEPPPETE